MNDKREKTVSGSESNISIVNCQLSIVNCQFSRSAFTLVELLTVVVIISMLAALSTVALTESMQTAREIKTRGTIQKLDTAIQSIFESYGDRFENILNESNYNDSTDYLSNENLTKLKMHLIHDAMRMEMPAHWGEVARNIGASGTIPVTDKITPIELTLPRNSGGPKVFQLEEPAVFRFYFNSVQRARSADNNCSTSNGSAETLFLMIANLNPEALEGFGGNEIKDTDGNGLMEFVDAWGNAIFYMRAAPGFVDTDRQPDVVHLANLTLSAAADNTITWTNNPLSGVTDWNANSLTQAYGKAAARWSDPFDGDNTYGRTWFLYPVIVSAGRDGIFDLAWGRVDAAGALLSPGQTASAFPSDIFPFDYPTGIPKDQENDGKLNHYDNIHNHRHSGGF